ncbi:MAG: chalcone isomerase family protein [Desulfococcaceae bacterium]
MIQTELRIDTALWMLMFFFTVFFFGGFGGATLASVDGNDGPFEPRFAVADWNLELTGTGIIRYLGLFKVSEVALYMPAEVPADQVLKTDTPRRLEVRYFRDLKKDDFVKSTRVWIRKNVSEGEYKTLEPKIERLNALYEDVKEGDRYGLTYVPGKGTTLDLNGREIGAVSGGDFARALFSIWLGEEPVEDGLPGELLGRA